MKKIYLFLIASTLLYSDNLNCFFKKENKIEKIICKYTLSLNRISNKERNFNIKWINPKGLIERERNITIEPKYKSFYDYRYKKNRLKGKWEVIVKEIK